MEFTFEEGRLYLHRSPDEREPLLRRLRRIEGQVRGLQQMIEQDRYCLDEVTQANAIIAALREVAVLIMDQHLRAGVGVFVGVAGVTVAVGGAGVAVGGIGVAVAVGAGVFVGGTAVGVGGAGELAVISKRILKLSFGIVTSM